MYKKFWTMIDPEEPRGRFDRDTDAT